jgi:hypothetical protein
MQYKTEIINNKVTMSKMCDAKKDIYSITVDKESYDRWKAGELIQNVFPDLSIEEREFMISGYTPPEFDLIFSGLEE